jgi:hypothetical protein
MQERAARAALVVAHPGHELRIHGWVERTRPLVFALTDGSGAHGRSRLDSTTTLLARVGATPGSIYGVVSDRQLYEIILARDVSWFVALASSLLDALLAAQVDIVAADALEGFSPAHDLCRHIVDAVITRAAAEGRSLQGLAFALDGAVDVEERQLTSGCVRLELSDDELARKLAAARAYEGLDQEVNELLRRHGAEPFRREVLWPADAVPFAPADPPAYERFGENRRDVGTYREVIRRREHIQPIVEALERFASRTVSSAQTIGATGVWEHAAGERSVAPAHRSRSVGPLTTGGTAGVE